MDRHLTDKRGETAAHMRLKRLSLLWAQAQGVRLRNSDWLGRTHRIRWRSHTRLQTGMAGKRSRKSPPLAAVNRSDRDTDTENHIRGCDCRTLSTFLTARALSGNRNEQISAGHFLWPLHSE